MHQALDRWPWGRLCPAPRPSDSTLEQIWFLYLCPSSLSRSPPPPQAHWAFQNQTHTVQRGLVSPPPPRVTGLGAGMVVGLVRRPSHRWEVTRGPRGSPLPRHMPLPPSRLEGWVSGTREGASRAGVSACPLPSPNPRGQGQACAGRSLLHKQPCGGRGCSWTQHHELPWAVPGPWAEAKPGP